MTKMFRRIVVGIDEQGKSVFESDNEPAVTFTMEDEFPGVNNIDMWQTEGMSPDLHAKHMINAQDYNLNLPPGVTRFGTTRMPPIKDLPRASKENG